LCGDCGRVLAPSVVQGELAAVELTVIAGCRTNAELVAMLGHWKYRGVRGLAWPLAPLLTAAIATATDRYGAVDLLVPVPLHHRRRRRRGFNQAAVLAHLAAADFALPVGSGVLCRTRATGQQAKLQEAHARRRNVRGAFAARPRANERGLRVGLVDDLVTGGATCCEAARALVLAGWQVRWVAALGLAAGPGPALNHTAGEAPVDRVAAEF
jgi:ComF family protein